MSISPRLIEGLATGAVGMVTGGLMYITIIDSPARAKLSPKEQLKNWQIMFPPAASFFKPASFLLVPALCTTAYVTEKPIYYAAAIALGVFVSFTKIAIVATNNRLLTMKEPADQQAEQEVVDMVRLWAQRHTVRLMFSIVGFGLCLYGYGNEKSI